MTCTSTGTASIPSNAIVLTRETIAVPCHGRPAAPRQEIKHSAAGL
jgi:hypothetical protein